MEIQELGRYFSGQKGKGSHLVAMKVRTIELMVLADYSISDIAQTVCLTKGQVYRLLREYNQPEWYKDFINKYYDHFILSGEYPVVMNRKLMIVK
jgi:hypothetical protein